MSFHALSLNLSLHVDTYELKRALDRSRNGKAPECDIIPNEVYTTGNKVMM